MQKTNKKILMLLPMLVLSAGVQAQMDAGTLDEKNVGAGSTG